MPNERDPGDAAVDGPGERRPDPRRPARTRHVPRSVLREAIVLAHVVPGAELRLVTDRGELLVGRHPAHDLSPCELRQAFLAGAAPGAPDCFRTVRDVELGGSLRDLGGGMYELWPCDGSAAQRWFATALHPTDIVELVETCDLDVADDAMDAGVATDSPLAISAVKVSPSRPEHRDRLEEVARWFLGRCIVEELVQRVEAEAVTPGS